MVRVLKKWPKFQGGDKIVDGIVEALNRYGNDHRSAKIHVYRQDEISVRIRILNEEFEDQSQEQREAPVWKLLSKLPYNIKNDISMLLLLTPDEASDPDNLVNLEFEKPQPSLL